MRHCADLRESATPCIEVGGKLGLGKSGGQTCGHPVFNTEIVLARVRGDGGQRLKRHGVCLPGIAAEGVFQTVVVAVIIRVGIRAKKRKVGALY